MNSSLLILQHIIQSINSLSLKPATWTLFLLLRIFLKQFKLTAMATYVWFMEVCVRERACPCPCVCVFVYMPAACRLLLTLPVPLPLPQRRRQQRRLLDVQLECNLLWKLSLHLSVKFTLGCLTVVACCHVGGAPSAHPCIPYVSPGHVFSMQSKIIKVFKYLN